MQMQHLRSGAWGGFCSFYPTLQRLSPLPSLLHRALDSRRASDLSTGIKHFPFALPLTSQPQRILLA